MEHRTLLAITATWISGAQTLDIQGANEREAPFPAAEVEDFKVTAQQNGGTGSFFVKIFQNNGQGVYNVPVTIQNPPSGGLIDP